MNFIYDNTKYLHDYLQQLNSIQFRIDTIRNNLHIKKKYMYTF